MKKQGFLQVFNEINWIACAIDQAMSLCDELLIVEGSQFTLFPHIPERSDDGTLDIIIDKMQEYPGRISMIETVRKHESYRQNQCDNFNNALANCNLGDYFIMLDADEFFATSWITTVNKKMAIGDIDVFNVMSRDFAFSFKWILDVGNTAPRPIIVKKVEGLRFIPTHKMCGAGDNTHLRRSIDRFHYAWLKPKDRMRMRMETSRMYPNMLNWFEKAWDSLELIEGAVYKGYSSDITLKQYRGKHPVILKDHPWRNVEDVRKL